MANIGIQTLTASDIHDVTTVKNGVLGQIATTKDGRKYRYAKNGATALAAGATVEKSATANVSTTTSRAHKTAEGALAITTAVSAANAPKYEDGVVTVANAKYLVNGVNSTTVSLNDRLDAPVASGATAVLAASQFCGVVAGSTTVIGTAEIAVPANAYFWAFVQA